jgi:hypothetical protein
LICHKISEYQWAFDLLQVVSEDEHLNAAVVSDLNPTKETRVFEQSGCAQVNTYNDPPEFVAWRDELAQLGPSELRGRAVEAGVPSVKVDAAEDSPDPTNQVIALIFEQELEARAATVRAHAVIVIVAVA